MFSANFPRRLAAASLSPLVVMIVLVGVSQPAVAAELDLGWTNVLRLSVRPVRLVPAAPKGNRDRVKYGNLTLLEVPARLRKRDSKRAPKTGLFRAPVGLTKAESVVVGVLPEEMLPRSAKHTVEVMGLHGGWFPFETHEVLSTVLEAEGLAVVPVAPGGGLAADGLVDRIGTPDLKRSPARQGQMLRVAGWLPPLHGKPVWVVERAHVSGQHTEARLLLIDGEFRGLRGGLVVDRDANVAGLLYGSHEGRGLVRHLNPAWWDDVLQ